MLVTSRSFGEYEAFFGLSSADLAGTVLDCSAGASGFVAAVNGRGGRATAVDPVYEQPAEELGAAANAALVQGEAILARHADRYLWSWYGSLERHHEVRRTALAAFLADLHRHPGSYVPGSLPHLPFDDGAFDLAVCSHLLFTWSNVFDEAWHEAAVLELLRVASEVRLFPLVAQGAGEPVPFLPTLIDRLRSLGHRADVVDVPYEFQRGASQMLAVKLGGGPA